MREESVVGRVPSRSRRGPDSWIAGSAEDAARAALEGALALTRIDREAHAATKLRVRRFALESMRAGIDADFAA